MRRRTKLDQAVCAACIVQSAQGERPVELRNWFAPWRFFCERHPPTPTAVELDSSIEISTVLRDVTQFSARLEKVTRNKDPYDETRTDPLFYDDGNWIDLVREINMQVEFRVRKAPDGAPMFEVYDECIGPQDTASKAVAIRNSPIISAWYAACIAKDPGGFLFRNTRNINESQAHRFLTFLAKFLAPDVLFTPWRRASEVTRLQLWDPLDFHDNFIRQAQLLRTTNLVRTLYALRARRTRRERLPWKETCNDQCERPPAAWQKPSSAELQPCLSMIQEVVREAQAKGPPIRFGYIQRKAFRRMRRRLEKDCSALGRSSPNPSVADG